MSGPHVLELDGAGKSYRGYSTVLWRAAGWVSGKPSHFVDNWVLRDISFNVMPGEAIGIVGRNGAGKSTLLKIIAGTLVPTEGRVVARGRISAILELGMGFNPEFSGRRNAGHACGLLGYDTKQIQELLPWIEAFADIGDYFDLPMRTYSSGMAMRVAFGVATAVRPDILIVDEALSVGDAAFQRKSFRRIEEFLEQGTSLLFVTHATETIKKMCGRAVWVDRGRIRMDGGAKEVVEAYEKDMFSAGRPTPPMSDAPVKSFLDHNLLLTGIEQQYGDGLARIVAVRILDATGTPANVLPSGERFSVEFDVAFSVSCRDVHFGMMVKTVEGVAVYGTNTDHAGLRDTYAAGETARVAFQMDNHLCPETYFLNCGASHGAPTGRAYLHRRVDVAAFRVVTADRNAVAGLADLHGRARILVVRQDADANATSA